MCEYCEVKMPEPFYDKTSRVEGRVRLWVDAREGLEPSIEFSKEAEFDHWHTYFPIKFCPMCGRKLAERGRGWCG